MRIAAGVLLIIMSVINVAVGVPVLLGGSVVSAASSDDVASQLHEDGVEITEEGQAELANAGSKLTAYGGFLTVLCGLMIAAAVMLFTKKKPTFVMGVAALGLLAEGLGVWWTGFGLLNAFGLAVAIFAFLGAKAISDARDARGAPATA